MTAAYEMFKFSTLCVYYRWMHLWSWRSVRTRTSGRRWTGTGRRWWHSSTCLTDSTERWGQKPAHGFDEALKPFFINAASFWVSFLFSSEICHYFSAWIKHTNNIVSGFGTVCDPLLFLIKSVRPLISSRMCSHSEKRLKNKTLSEPNTNKEKWLMSYSFWICHLHWQVWFAPAFICSGNLFFFHHFRVTKMYKKV